MNVLVPAELDPDQQADVSTLLAARATADDGHPALPEPLRAMVAGGALDDGAVTALGYDGSSLAGFALLTEDHDGAHSLHLAVDPARSAGDTQALWDALVHAALGATGTSRPIRLWAMRAGPSDDEAAARFGFVQERDVIQMRVALPLATELVAGAHPVPTRPFDPDRDTAVWLDINNRAFAGHPEQGNWTEDQLQARLSADWVDLNGFLMADAPDGGLIGSCLTKVHRSTRPVMGEIYIISVNPDRHGQGWGKALTVAGLAWLASQGITVGMLYTDADNAAAVALYRSLGFTVDHADRSYLLTDPVL